MRPGFLPLLLLAGCVLHGAAPQPHYVLGDAYRQDGVWYCPVESFDLDETGLAAVYGGHAGSTSDGEAFDQGALAAAHPTLQLPALARLTNLENGRQVVVRINDRGPVTPERPIAVTRRVAQLLAAADPSAIRLRLQVLEGESRQMVAALRPEAPRLAIVTAPSASVQSESLAPPGGAPAAPVPAPAPLPAAAIAPSSPAATVPLRLPEAVTQTWVRPGRLAIECGAFGSPDPAEVMRERLARLGAQTGTDYYAPRDRAYIVRIGPLPSVAAADAMLRRALAAGATDARIVILE